MKKTHETISAVNKMMDMPKMKPYLNLTEDDCPEIKGWQVGKTYTVTVKMKQIAMRERKGEGMSAEFEVEDVKV